MTLSQEFKETSVNQDPLWSQFYFPRLRRGKHSPQITAGFFPYKTAMLPGFSLHHSWIYNFHLTREACWLCSPCLLSLNWATSKWKYQMESHISLWFRYLVSITALATNQQLLYKRSSPAHHVRGDKTQMEMQNSDGVEATFHCQRFQSKSSTLVAQMGH